MMQHRRVEGKQLGYRPVAEAELTQQERRRAYDGQERATNALAAQSNLIYMASNDHAHFSRLSRWIVATCRSGSEQRISEDLQFHNIDTWCPMQKFRIRPRRGLKAVDILRPFFRGYLFIRLIPCHEAYAGVLCASQLRGIMGRDGKPFLMPEKLMDALMLGVKKGQFLQKDEIKMPVSVGDHAVIRGGPFTGLQAIVRSLLPDRWRAQVEVTILGGSVPVELDIDSLVP